jgi:hypothetical protein
MAGRPTKYKEDYNEQAYRLCLLGHTDAELAVFFEVNEDTIHEWKKVYPNFSESIKKGKDIADGHVADSLYKRATGYSHEAVKIFVQEGQEIIVPYTEHYPPDATSMIFWLKNRQRKKWRDKVETGITDNDGNDVITLFKIPDNGRNQDNTATTGLSDQSPK